MEEFKMPAFSNRARRSGAVLTSVLAVLAIAFPLLAQAPNTATIRGRVTDETGAPIPGALVTVLNRAAGYHRKATSRTDGSYVVPYLPLTGAYGVEIALTGFAPKEKGGLVLRAGETMLVDAVLRPLGVRSDLTVSGSTENVRGDSAQLGARVDPATIATTPVLGRKVTSLPLLSSQVRPARGTGDLFLGATLFVSGSGGRRQTTYSIDGVTADDAWGRQTMFTSVPFAAIEELGVVTSTAPADFGRTTGNALNLITRTGSNNYRSDLTLVARPGGWQPSAPVTGLSASDALTQGSALVSGPLAKDRLFFTAAAEYTSQKRDSEVTSPLAPQIHTGDIGQTLVLARVDGVMNESHRATLRFSSDTLSDTNPADAVGGNTLPSAAREFSRRAYSGALSENAIFSASLFNEARAGISVGSPITEFEPLNLSTQLVRPGVSTEGESRSTLLYNHQYQLADTLSFWKGPHAIRVGVEYITSSSGGSGTEFGSNYVLGQFTFKPGISPSIPTSALTINDVQRYQQGFGSANYNVSDNIWTVFVQDDIRVLPSLTVNAGLRYDRQTLTDDTSMIAPRIGLAYTPDSQRRTVIRGGWGIYYSQLRANIESGYTLGGPEGLYTYSAAPGQPGFPTSIAPLPEFPPGAVLPARDITIRPGRRDYYARFFDVSKLRVYPDELLNPQTKQASLGIEREISSGFFLGLDTVSSRTTNIERNIDANAPSYFERTAPGQTRSASAADATRPITPAANGYRRIFVTVNQGEASYDGLTFTASKKFATRGAVNVSYTWSHSRNNIEPDAPGGDPNDVNRLDLEWTDSILDQRHRVVLSGWAKLPLGLRGGGIFTLASGRPYNITTGSDNNGDGANVDRPIANGVVVARNSGEGSTVYDITLFLEREFQLGGGVAGSLRIEGFNLTNHLNAVGRNGVYGNTATPLSSLGAPLGGIANVEPARQFQLMARIAFN
jgi:outer membrane receptor for ferrienterochelin and colicin